MRCLDLFSGAASGWTLGVHRAGWQTVAACEFDPWRRAVFSANWPNARMYDDVRTLSAGDLAADGVGRIDAIIGSPPCQDASTANAKGRGVDGERTGLFFEAVRLVREVRPRWVAFENVPGIRARGVDRVLGALEEIDYTVWPLVVGAWHAGAPHRRARVWFIGRRNEPADADGREPQGPRRLAVGCVEVGARAVGTGFSADAGREHSDGWQDLRAGHGEPNGDRPAHGQEAQRAADGGAPHAANPSGDGVRQQQGRRGWPDGTGAAEPADDADRHADAIRRTGADALQQRQPETIGAARDTDQTGLAQREGERGDARAEQQTAVEASLRAWDHWNGGAPDLGRVDARISQELASLRVRSVGRQPDERLGRPSRKLKTTGVGRNILAAYGDSVVPAITEQIARAIDAWEHRGRFD